MVASCDFDLFRPKNVGYDPFLPPKEILLLVKIFSHQRNPHFTLFVCAVNLTYICLRQKPTPFGPNIFLYNVASNNLGLFTTPTTVQVVDVRTLHNKAGLTLTTYFACF